MSLDKAIQHGKEHRWPGRCKPYQLDWCSGRCLNCDTSRNFNARKRILSADDKLRDYEGVPELIEDNGGDK